MRRDTIYSMSDIHLGSKHFHCPLQKDNLWTLLSTIERDVRAKTLVLNGDIIETWSSPMNTVYSIQQILANDDVAKFAQCIRSILDNGVEVVYIVGNHDSRVREEYLKDLFGYNLQVAITYETCRVHFSHGHKYDYFNSADPLQHNNDGLFPVGYYATRIDEEFNIGFAHEKRDSLRDFLNDKLPIDITAIRKLLKEEQLLSVFFTHLWGKAVVKGLKWPKITDEDSKAETMHVISDKLKPLYKVWAHGVGDSVVAAMLRCAATADYSYFLQNGFYGDVDIVVHGHTHKPVKYSAFTENRKEILYINSGAWEDTCMTYVKIVIDPTLNTVISSEVVSYKTPNE